MHKKLTITLGVLVALALLTLSFVAGLASARLIPALAKTSPAAPANTQLEKAVREVDWIIQRMAIDPSSPETMTTGAISGMLEALDDQHALYFDPSHYQYFNESNAGEFSGIGVTIASREESLTIVSVLQDTPAERAGLKPDDVIVSIDGVTREKWDVDEAVKRIRGEEGTAVAVGVRRAGEASNLEFSIVRATIELPSIETELLGGDVGYILVYSFNMKTEDGLREAIKDLEGQGAKGFILDLRDNPGGLLNESVDVLSLFVKDGVAVRVKERGQPEREHFVTGKTATAAPLVVLVNEYSASASEIVAGALQDYGRATVVGATTFGKGSVQQVEELSFGGAIKLTIAHYLTPKGRVIEKQGVAPDVVVEMDMAERAHGGADVQRAKAEEVLRAKLKG